MRAENLRQRYLDFFKERGHTIRPGDSLVPKEDATLLFTGAGMNQFKQMFLGKAISDFRRAVTCQKCFRTTDVENVGRTTRHLTFMEMLGNFSFGDYFKEEAIEWAWDLVAGELKIPKEKLWISIFKDDDEAFRIWQKLGIPEERIVRLGEEDNFWDMGPTGPCGPCSEIIFDRGKDKGCGKKDCTVGCDCDRFLELWNLVFTQFDRQPDGRLLPLSQKNIDTGMGLERTLAVLEGKETIFETSILKPIIDAVVEAAGVSYGIEENKDISLRIMADHLRASTFLIGDGVLPSNEGRGYVLRRLIRRAVRQGRRLGMDKPFLYPLTAVVVDVMKDAYPELTSRRDHISQVVLSEEERFQSTLQQGIEILEGMIGELRKEGKREIPGEAVFKLYDTHGFPLSLTEELAGESGLTVDKAGFEKVMRRQQELARAAWGGTGKEEISSVYSQLPSKFRRTEFVGYESTDCQAEVLAIIKEDKLIDRASTGEEIEIILNKTPFYGEAGGQVGDIGTLTSESVKAEVTDAQKPLPELTVHKGKVVKGKLVRGMNLKASVDVERRSRIARSHTATHLLQNVLRQVLGEHVAQSGSLVAPERLRFDFTHFKAISDRQLDRIEELVNEKIRENARVEIIHTDLEKAKKMGAIALFGEKYEDEVRLINIGDYSKELCGGTHLQATGGIGLFKITVESSVAAGIRRIEALTGKEAYRLIKDEEAVLKEIGEILKTHPREAAHQVGELVKKTRALEKQINRLKHKDVLSRAETLLRQAVEVGGIKVISSRVDNVKREEMGSLIDHLKEKMGEAVIVLGTVIEGKVALAAGVTRNLVEKGFHAGSIIKEVAKVAGGSGGGREDYAQAGGKDPLKLDQALKKVPQLIRKEAENGF